MISNPSERRQMQTPWRTRVFFKEFLFKLAALDGQKTVAWVFVDAEASRQVATFGSLVFAEVVNALLLTTAQGDFFTVQVVCNTL